MKKKVFNRHFIVIIRDCNSCGIMPLVKFICRAFIGHNNEKEHNWSKGLNNERFHWSPGSKSRGNNFAKTDTCSHQFSLCLRDTIFGCGVSMCGHFGTTSRKHKLGSQIVVFHRPVSHPWEAASDIPIILDAGLN